MAGAYCVEAFFRFGIHVGAYNLADKNYMVAGGDLRFERTFEIRHGVGQ